MYKVYINNLIKSVIITNQAVPKDINVLLSTDNIKEAQDCAITEGLKHQYPIVEKLT